MRPLPVILFALLLWLSLTFCVIGLYLWMYSRDVAEDARLIKDAEPALLEERSYVEAHIIRWPVWVGGLLATLVSSAAASWLVFRKTTLPSGGILLVGLVLLAMSAVLMVLLPSLVWMTNE